MILNERLHKLLCSLAHRQTDQGVLYCCGHDIPTINIIPASLYVHLAYHLALCVIMTSVLNKF